MAGMRDSRQQPPGLGSTIRQNLDVPLVLTGRVSDIRVGGPGGQLAAIGGKRAVLLIDLDQPRRTVLSLKFPSAWDKVELAWNYSQAHSSVLASSNNRDALVWDVAAEQSTATVAEANRQPITCLAWAPFFPHLLATCSADSTVNLFDVRTLAPPPSRGLSSGQGAPQRPSLSLTSPGLPGASVLAWNRTNGNVLATAHSNQLWLWDIRGGSSAQQRPPPASVPSAANGTGAVKSYQPHLDLLSPAAASSLKPLNADAAADPFGFLTGIQTLEEEGTLPLSSTQEVASRSLQQQQQQQLSADTHAVNSSDEISSPATEGGVGGGGSGFALRCLVGHAKRILDLDWAYGDAHSLATASQDKTVKFWDVSSFGSDGGGGGGGGGGKSRHHANLLSAQTSSSPDDLNDTGGVGVGGGGGGGSEGGGGAGESCVVGRLERAGQFADVQQLRFTPFGQGLVTISHAFGEARDAPQTLRLWSLVAMSGRATKGKGDGLRGGGGLRGEGGHHRGGGIAGHATELSTPDSVCVFKGHSAPIVGFDWRTQGSAFQMVSLNENLRLRLHAIEGTHLESCGATIEQRSASFNSLLQSSDADPSATREKRSSSLGDPMSQSWNNHTEAELEAQRRGGHGISTAAGAVAAATATTDSASSFFPSSSRSSSGGGGITPRFLPPATAAVPVSVAPVSKLSLASLKTDLYPNPRPTQQGFGSEYAYDGGGGYGDGYGSSGGGGGGGVFSSSAFAATAAGGGGGLGSSVLQDEVAALLELARASNRGGGGGGCMRLSRERRQQQQGLFFNSENGDDDGDGGGGGGGGVWTGVELRRVWATSEDDSSSSSSRRRRQQSLAETRTATFVVTVGGETARTANTSNNSLSVLAEESPDSCHNTAVKVVVTFPVGYPLESRSVPAFQLEWLHGADDDHNEKNPAAETAETAAAAAAAATAAVSASLLPTTPPSTAGKVRTTQRSPRLQHQQHQQRQHRQHRQHVLQRLGRAMERTARRASSEDHSLLCLGAAFERLVQGLKEFHATHSQANATNNLTPNTAAAAAAALEAAAADADTATATATTDATAGHLELVPLASPLRSKTTAAQDAAAAGASSPQASLPLASLSLSKERRQPAPRTSGILFGGANSELVFFGLAQFSTVKKNNASEGAGDAKPNPFPRSYYDLKTRQQQQKRAGEGAAALPRRRRRNGHRRHRRHRRHKNDKQDQQEGPELLSSPPLSPSSFSGAAGTVQAWELPLSHPSHDLGTGHTWRYGSGGGDNDDDGDGGSDDDDGDGSDSYSDSDDDDDDSSNSSSSSLSSSSQDLDRSRDDKNADGGCNNESGEGWVISGKTGVEVPTAAVERGVKAVREEEEAVVAAAAARERQRDWFELLALASSVRILCPERASEQQRKQERCHARAMQQSLSKQKHQERQQPEQKQEQEQEQATLVPTATAAAAMSMAARWKLLCPGDKRLGMAYELQDQKDPTKCTRRCLPTSSSSPLSLLTSKRRTEKSQLKARQSSAVSAVAASSPSPSTIGDGSWFPGLAVAAVAKRCQRNGRRASKLGFDRQAKLWLLVSSSVAGVQQDYCVASATTAAASKKSATTTTTTGSGVATPGTVQGPGCVAGLGGVLRPWAGSCAGAALVRRVLSLCASDGDVQTLAVIGVTLRSCYWTAHLLLGAADVEKWVLAYAELLWRWGCYEERLELLKLARTPPTFRFFGAAGGVNGRAFNGCAFNRLSVSSKAPPLSSPLSSSSLACHDRFGGWRPGSKVALAFGGDGDGGGAVAVDEDQLSLSVECAFCGLVTFDSPYCRRRVTRRSNRRSNSSPSPSSSPSMSPSSSPSSNKGVAAKKGPGASSSPKDKKKKRLGWAAYTEEGGGHSGKREQLQEASATFSVAVALATSPKESVSAASSSSSPRRHTHPPAATATAATAATVAAVVAASRGHHSHRLTNSSSRRIRSKDQQHGDDDDKDASLAPASLSSSAGSDSGSDSGSSPGGADSFSSVRSTPDHYSLTRPGFSASLVRRGATLYPGPASLPTRKKRGQAAAVPSSSSSSEAFTDASPSLSLFRSHQSTGCLLNRLPEHEQSKDHDGGGGSGGGGGGGIGSLFVAERQRGRVASLSSTSSLLSSSPVSTPSSSLSPHHRHHQLRISAVTTTAATAGVASSPQVASSLFALFPGDNGYHGWDGSSMGVASRWSTGSSKAHSSAVHDGDSPGLATTPERHLRAAPGRLGSGSSGIDSPPSGWGSFESPEGGGCGEGQRRRQRVKKSVAVDGGAALAPPVDGCGQWSSLCTLCRRPCRGLLMACSKCGHGGHPDHLRAWFSGAALGAARCGDSTSATVADDDEGWNSEDKAVGGKPKGRALFAAARGFCPSGCGCRCAQVMAETWGPALRS